MIFNETQVRRMIAFAMLQPSSPMQELLGAIANKLGADSIVELVCPLKVNTLPHEMRDDFKLPSIDWREVSIHSDEPVDSRVLIDHTKKRI